MAIPTLDAPLAEWSTNFNDLGSAHPLDFNLTAPQMTQYGTLHDLYIDAYNAAKADGSKSKALVQDKSDKKKNLLDFARQLYGFVQSSRTVTNENKVLIGVKVRDRIPSPSPAPALAPMVKVKSVIGRQVRCTLSDATASSKRRRPVNAEGATILSFVGATPPPTDDPMWKLEGQTGKTTFVIQFPNTVAPGTACWVTAMWYNARGEYSPASEPMQTYLQVGPVAESA